MTKIRFLDAYKRVRNQWRPFRRSSIVLGILETLAKPVETPLDDLKRAPWEALLLVKWLMQDRLAQEGGPAISTPQLEHLRQAVHEITKHIELMPENGSGQILFRQIVHSQMQFQRRFSKGLLREAGLLNSLPLDHPLRKLFKERTGLTEEAFSDFALVAFTAIVSESRSVIPPKWFDSLESAYGRAMIDCFVAAISRNYDELEAFFRSLPNANDRATSELYEFPLLKRYPFLRDSVGMHCWHRMVFLRGIEGFVHSVISEAGGGAFEQFTRLFERHVISEARRSGADCVVESELKSIVGHNREVPDALISLPGVNVFVEAKAGLFDESVMVVGDAEILARKTRAIRKAISQGWSGAVSIRESQSAPAQARHAERDYLLIVTNKELSASNGRRLLEMYPDGRLAYPSPEAERHLPVERIYVVSIEDFERLMSAVAEGAVDLGSFLAECVQADGEPATSVYFFDQHLNRARLTLGFSPVVESFVESTFARVESALGKVTVDH